VRPQEDNDDWANHELGDEMLPTWLLYQTNQQYLIVVVY